MNTERLQSDTSEYSLKDLGDKDVEDTKETRVLSLDEAFDEIDYGDFHTHVIILVGLTHACESIELGMMAFLQECIREEWDLSYEAEALLSSAAFVGQIIGMLCTPAADVYGRRPIVMCGWICVTVFGIASYFSPDYYTLVALRTMVGYGIGISQTTSYDIACELLPQAYRSRATYIGMVNAVGGVYLLTVMYLMLGPYGWKSILIMASLPALCICTIGCFFLPESPRWLLSQGHIEEAEAKVKFIADYNGYDGLGKFRLSTVGCEEENPEKECGILDLWSPRLLPTTLRLYVVWFLVYFANFSVFLTLAMTLREEDSKTCTYDFAGAAYSGVTDFAMVLLGVTLIDDIGRCISQISFFSLASIFFLAFTCVRNAGGTKETLVGLMICGKAFLQGGCSALWIHAPELLPTEVRATGHSTAVVVGRTGAIVATFWIDSLSVKEPLLGGLGFTFAILIAGLTAYTLKETTGCSLDDDEKIEEKEKLIENGQDNAETATIDSNASF